MKQLIEGGADVYIKTFQGATPLQIARVAKQEDAVQ
ncbi:hypothetical protein MY5147_004976, partial [Beauveria neobassiana]